MPTAEELERGWAAQWALHGGHPPGPEHEDRLREDPAYRASHEASTEHNMAVSGGKGYDTGIELYWDKRNRRIVQIISSKETPIYGEVDDGIIGVASYDPKTGRESFKSLPRRQ